MHLLYAIRNAFSKINFFWSFTALSFKQELEDFQNPLSLHSTGTKSN